MTILLRVTIFEDADLRPRTREICGDLWVPLRWMQGVRLKDDAVWLTYCQRDKAAGRPGKDREFPALVTREDRVSAPGG